MLHFSKLEVAAAILGLPDTGWVAVRKRLDATFLQRIADFDCACCVCVFVVCLISQCYVLHVFVQVCYMCTYTPIHMYYLLCTCCCMLFRCCHVWFNLMCKGSPTSMRPPRPATPSCGWRGSSRYITRNLLGWLRLGWLKVP